MAVSGEAVRSSETSVNYLPVDMPQIPEDLNLHQHSCSELQTSHDNELSASINADNFPAI
jgi:hypothetical protein